MIRIDRPIHDAGDVFTVCISKVRDLRLKGRLTSITQAVSDASMSFDQAAQANRVFTIARHTSVNGVVTQEEMEKVYTQRMAKREAPGRAIYDSIYSSAQHGKCPLCAHRNVSTLDHYLPKAHFPSLAVAPLNLIPACGDCNKAKLAETPASAAEETLHPYFDDVSAERWLFAEVVQSRPASVRFFVRVPHAWGALLGQRIERHFTVFGLASLYAAEAADELLNIRHQLHSLHGAGGAGLVREELMARARSCERARINGWRTAVYYAFSESDWFCNGGFRA